MSSICFKIISYQAPIYFSNVLHFYTLSLLLRSSADTQLFRIPSFQWSPSFTRLHVYLSGTNSLFLFVMLPLLVLPSLPWFFLSFEKRFLWSHCAEMRARAYVCVRACVCVCKAMQCKSGCVFKLFRHFTHTSVHNCCSFWFQRI